MPTTITVALAGVLDAVQPVIDALDSILQSTVVPLQTQLACTKQITGNPPTSVAYTFPDSVPSDQVYNFYRRVSLEDGILSTHAVPSVPAGIPQALSFTGSEVAAYGQKT